MINCRECVDFILAYLDNELSEDERAQFQKHLDMCPPCKKFIDEYQDCIRAASCCYDEEEDKPVSDKVPEALVSAILSARKKP